MTNANLN